MYKLKVSGTFCVTVLSIATAICWAADQKITFQPQPNKIFIKHGDKTIATYVHKDPHILRPHFTDLKTPSGTQVTRNHPPKKGIDADDHATMHTGLWLAFGDINGADFWRNKGKVENAGFIIKTSPDKKTTSLLTSNKYIADDKIICHEACKFTVLVRPAGYLILWKSTFYSDDAPFYFGDQEEMGLGVRLATPIVVKSGKGGRIIDDKGNRNEKQIWGKPSLWCDYAGPIDNVFAGVMVMPDPDNFAPSRWHTRDYGFMTANPFAKKAFNAGDANKTTVQKDKSLTLRFGILIHSSKDEKSINLPAEYKNYLSQKDKF